MLIYKVMKMDFTQQKVNQIMKLKVEMHIMQKNIFETFFMVSLSISYNSPIGETPTQKKH